MSFLGSGCPLPRGAEWQYSHCTPSACTISCMSGMMSAGGACAARHPAAANKIKRLLRIFYSIIDCITMFSKSRFTSWFEVWTISTATTCSFGSTKKCVPYTPDHP